MSLKRALVVEDDKNWRRRHKSQLESIVGAGNVDAADTYHAAWALVMTSEYDAYVLDGEFPSNVGQPVEELGVPLAQEVHKREESFDKVKIVSGRDRVLDAAKALGIAAYTKSPSEEEDGYPNASKLYDDVREMLGL